MLTGQIIANMNKSMLTDFYQITITQAYFREGRQDEYAVFDLFYRTQPFKGTFAVFGGLAEAVDIVKNYKFTEDDLEYIRGNLPGCSDEFIDYLRNIDMKKLKITALPEGTIVFPREPLMRIEGPISYCQLIETPLLNAINFPTLMTTNAHRFRLHAGPEAKLMEFGLRRAQGPNGAMAATRYSFAGGFDSTSNVLAGKQFGIPIAGTVAHSFVTSFVSIDQLKTRKIAHKETGELIDLYDAAKEAIAKMNYTTNESELISFISQALTYPNNFLALVDTYDTLKSGVPNFLAVSYGLHKAGYKGAGIRLDSGDLVMLSKATRAMFIEFGKVFDIPYAAKFCITASNDINEDQLIKLKTEGHEINAYGIGTHLVTCQRQPALGGVYKLVEIDNVPRVKLSNSLEKTTLPGKKDLYRLYDENKKVVADLMTVKDEVPEVGEISGFMVYPEAKKFSVKCASAESLYVSVWENGEAHVDDVKVVRERVMNSKTTFDPDVVAVENEKKYPVLISEKLNALLQELMKQNSI